MILKNMMAVGMGGFMGAILRFLVSSRISTWTGADFPYGTLAVNAAGSLFLGFLSRYFLEHFIIGDTVRTGILVGLLGAFTTFSTFSFESVMLIQNGEPAKGLFNLVLNNVLCLFLCFAGLKLSRFF